MSQNRLGHLDIATVSSSPSNARSLFHRSTFVYNDNDDEYLLVVCSNDAVVETSASSRTTTNGGGGTPPTVTILVVLVGNTKNADATVLATRKIK